MPSINHMNSYQQSSKKDPNSQNLQNLWKSHKCIVNIFKFEHDKMVRPGLGKVLYAHVLLVKVLWQLYSL